MSSHHIVRENQEPALIIEDFHALDRNSLDQLLEWSPTVIVDTYSFDFLLSEGIKVDILFSNDPISEIQEQTQMYPVKEGYLQSALSYLVSKSYGAVNVMCRELDPILSEYVALINIVAFCKDRRYVFVTDLYQKWKAKGEKVYFDPQELLSQEGLELVEANVYVTSNDGFFTLKFNTGKVVCIGEDI